VTSRDAPLSPLEPAPGEPGYVSSVHVVAELAAALSVVGTWLSASRPGHAYVERATDALRDARTLVDVLQQRLTRETLRDVRTNDEEAQR
jgi:hypothetical protein